MADATFEPRIEALERSLREGIAGSDANDPRRELGFSVEAADREVARSLVQTIAACDLADVGATRPRRDATGAQHIEEEATLQADSSFLGMLGTSGAAGLSVDRIDDVQTIIAVLRAGSRRQRRAALARLQQRLTDRKSLPGETVRTAVQTIAELRDVELGHELTHARAGLPGSEGRRARNEIDAWQRLTERMEDQIRHFWDGQIHTEPLQQLPGDRRAQLLMRVPDLSGLVVDHINAIMQGGEGGTSRDGRVRLVASLRFATDPRLVPALVGLVESERGELLVNAARAIGGIDDPRVHPVLADRFERTIVTDERLALAGALGMCGDCRGVGEVRNLLRLDEPPFLILALEAMETLGTPEDADLLLRFIEDQDVEVATQAARTLGKVSDGRVLDSLTERYNSSSIPALRATIEDALSAITARMELRGEEAIEIDWSEVGNKPVPKTGSRDRLATVLRGWNDYVVGRCWLLLGRLKPAIARFESASARRAGWVVPLIAVGMAFAHRGQYALALPAFRRALELDRTRIERNPIYVRAMAKSFLHRAEQVEREGRGDIARGLVTEVMTFDLRRAPGTVRFELKRLQEGLRREGYGSVGPSAA